jgi:catechol 2,3-dioxygenase-like lactoylglutathione lyase family enzyme
MNIIEEGQASVPRLSGVHHTAFPTWRPKATVEFYRDIMGLRIPHAIAATGWGRSGGEAHPDFLHFFFEAGDNSLIAFFYYVGTRRREEFTQLKGYLGLARHTAWNVETEDDLVGWMRRFRDKGVKVTEVIAHETLQSIYFVDPNGYNLEIARQTRPIDEVDRIDANLTIQALVETFGDDNPDNKTIGDMWRRKAELVRGRYFDNAK